jgi:Fur family ferric uptake transcriptional regulator
MKKSCAHKHTEKKQELASLTGRLRRESRKITGPRAAILEILRHHPHPLTNKEIFAELPKGGCDLVARFELVGEGDDGHHHHLICTRCARVVEIEECFPEEIERRIARANGFTGVTHRLEFFGVCPDCRK